MSTSECRYLRRMGEPDLMVRADLEMLEIIFENLLSNAIKYTPDGGKVTLLAALDDDQQVMIGVLDRGIGIPRSERKYIFQSFYAFHTDFHAQFMSHLGYMLYNFSVAFIAACSLMHKRIVQF